MLREMRRQGRKLSMDDIKTLENDLNVKLPESYKNFLLQYNGGRPTPECYPIERTEEVYIGNFGGIQFLYWIDGPEDATEKTKRCYNIRNNYENSRRRMPENFLPIACDDGGNHICLSLYGVDAGWIWYWDHEGEKIPPDWNYDLPSHVPDYSNCYKIAESFQEFIDGLFDFPKEEMP
jgi:hypothetical protein